MSAVFGAIFGVALTCVVGLLLLSRKYQLEPKNLKFGFVDFDVSRFADLSAVRAFDSLSRAVIAPSLEAHQWYDEHSDGVTPLVLMHLGWQVVCNAFVDRFARYPDDESVSAIIKDIGAQNAEFLRIYERSYQAALKNTSGVSAEFAREYFLRAPSLAQRVSKKGGFVLDGLYENASTAVRYVEYRETLRLLGGANPAA